MKRKHLLVAIATLILPLSTMAQGYHFVQKDGLEYICKDGDDPDNDENLFIYVGSWDWWTTTGTSAGVRILVKDDEGNEEEIKNSRYLYHPSLRANWRKNTFWNDNSAGHEGEYFLLWYKKYPVGHEYHGKGLDEMTDMSNVGKYAFGKIDDMRGVEYFTALQKLAVRGESTTYGLTLDLSNNHSFNSLTYSTNSSQQPKIRSLNITETQMTSLTFPTSTAAYLEELIMEDNLPLTTLTFQGTANFTKLKTLDLSHTGITTFSGQYLTALTSLTAQNSQLTTLDISYCTALEKLDVSGSSSLATLTVASSAQTALEEINVAGTALTSLDLSNYTNLATVTITTGQFGANNENLTLPGPGWAKIAEHGTTETWADVSKIHVLTVDVSDKTNKTVDVTNYTALHTLTVIGANEVILPSTANTTDHFTLTMTGCSDAYVDWSDREANLKELTLNDVKSFNASDFTNLETLRYMGQESIDLTLSTGNTTLKTLDITRSGLTELDLSGGEAPNLVTVKTWYAPLTKLDLTNHTSLLSAPYPSHDNMLPSTSKIYIKDGAYKTEAEIMASNPSDYADYLVTDPNEWIGLNLLPVTKSQHDWFDIYADEHFENSITDIADYNANNTLETIILAGCTSLTDVYLTHGADDTHTSADDDQWLYYNILKTVDMSGCTGLTGIHATNTLMTTLNLNNCSNLEEISIDQGLLAGKAASAGATGIWIDGCDNIKIFKGNRQQFTNLDFLLKPDGSRDASDIAKLQEIHASGGSYTIKDNEGAPIIRENGGNKIKITNRIGEIDLTNLAGWDEENPSSDRLRKLIIDCNLLKELDLSTNNIGQGLQQLVCSNNMLTTLDLSPLTEAVKNGVLNLNACDWKYQVSYASAEVVKGQWESGAWKTFETSEEEAAQSGIHDWVALHMEHGGFTHYMDNILGLYWNLHDARWDEEQGISPDAENSRSLAKEADSWMCRVTEVPTIAGTKDTDNELPGAEKFVGDNPCPVGHQEYQHIFLHSQPEITTDFGAFKDQDLTGCVLGYKYNTGFVQEHIKNEVTDKLNLDPAEGDIHYSLQKYESGFNYEISNYYAEADKINVKKDKNTEYTSNELIDEFGHIVVRVHLNPYLLNINPRSKSPMSVQQKQVDYFSSTVILDYDAAIPAGVTCYTTSRVKTTNKVFEVAGQALDGQLEMVAFGGEEDSDGNWILPANTPVYVKSTSPQPAGLYAFQPIREVNVLGWENVRGAYNQEDFMLHGLDDLNSGETFREGYSQEDLNKAKDRLTGSGKNAGNILEGYIAPKYDVDIYNEDYNKVVDATKTLGVNKRTVLVLGVQNQKSTWPVIGFWPYNGTTIQSHRCFIRSHHLYPSGTGSAKGFNFFFVGVEDVADVTGINTVDEKVTDENVWYNMQGVRLNAQPTQHGVYIHNGQKVVIK
ncbi:MAG: hypothetical protein IKS94_04445 [Prevotella sp.]|nr:hypothetical protein [Prevotella sp.]